jgi:hypothetical protein
MPPITELDVLLRVQAKLPDGLKLSTEDFREGWTFARTINALRLKQRIAARGWNFIRVADVSLRSGVGDTSEEAIANALMMTLRHVHTHFNAVEVEHIRLTQYPWFYLARVKVYPYIIQQSAILPVPDEAIPFPAAPRKRRLPASSSALYPYFNSAIPELKQILISSRTTSARPQ